MGEKQTAAFRAILEEYKREYLGARNLAARSRVEYETDLTQFLHFLEERNLHDVRMVESKHVKAYLAYLDRENFKSASRRRKLTVIRTFFAWLKESRRLSHNPGRQVRLPERNDPKPRVLTREEYQRLLRSVKQPRDAALIQLVLQTGVLLSELHRLNLADLALPARVGEGSLGTMSIRGIGSRNRTVVLNAKACLALHAWLKARPDAATDAVFVSNRRGRLSERQIQNIVGNYLAAAGIVGASVHSLRHTFTVHHLAKGTEVAVIQDVLGHESVDSTKVYIPVAKRKQASLLQKHAL